ncbi:MAG: immunoglobulin-like domain-containing protein [Lawsonibacter sp.]
MGIRKWAGFGVAVTLIILVLGAFVWWTSRPVALNAAELTPAGEGTSWPGTELSLNLTKYTLELTFVNDSSQAFYHGDPPDYCGLEVQSDGAWYQVPHKDYSTAGVGAVTGPGERFTFKPNLSPYGTLPDGQYRISFGYWKDETPLADTPAGVLYARFNRADGGYVLPNMP